MTITPETQTATGWTVDDSTFGARLALIRQRMNWNLKEAAKTCGLAPASWTNWERGEIVPRDFIDVCDKIAKVTGCDYLWLLTGSATGRRSTPRYFASPKNTRSRAVKPVDSTGPGRRTPKSRADSRRPALLRRPTTS